MIIKNISKKLNVDIPRSFRSHMIPAIRRGYALSSQLLIKEPWLNWVIGKETVPIIRRAAIEYELINLVDFNKINAKYFINLNAAKNCHHVEISSGNSILSVCQLRYYNQKPRRAVYRNTLSCFNMQQMSMFSNDNTKYSSKTYYSILAYGGSSIEYPNFVFIGVPTYKVSGWYYKLDLLGESVSMQSTDQEIISSENLIDLKDYIKKTGVLKDD